VKKDRKDYGTLRTNEQLVRRARIRRALVQRSKPENGYRTTQELADELGENYHLIDNDLAIMGAVKVFDIIDGKRYEWWVLPAYNPNLPDQRINMAEETIENEVAIRIMRHVIDVFMLGNEIIMKTERSAGPLVADWVSLLSWPEILHVSEERHSVVVKTIDDEVAEWVLQRLTGELRKEE